MKGLPLKIIDKIQQTVGSQFDELTMKFLGVIPKLSKEKKVVFTSAKNSLTSLFLQAIESRNPNKDEEEALKGLLRVANDYMDALKSRTQAKIIHNANAYAQETNAKKEPLSPFKIKNIINSEMDKSYSQLKMIIGAESHKAVNTGTAIKIQRLAGESGEEDPTVFFLVTIDDVTGPYEYILHLLPDKITPRAWKLSEIQAGYFKPGDQYPSLSGLHPNCRCIISYLPRGFAFDGAGKIKWKNLDWDELKYQRENFPPPNLVKK